MPLDMGLNGSTTTTPSGSLINNRRGTATAKGSGMANTNAALYTSTAYRYLLLSVAGGVFADAIKSRTSKRLARQVMGRVLAMRQLAATIQKIEAEAEPLECDEHESYEGPIGNTVYCDGSCRAGFRGRR